MPVNTTPAETADQREGSLPINELFYSIQGEGRLAGTPSVFVRTSGCNLRCWFCDSYHTSWEPTQSWMEVDEIVQEVTTFEQATHVVVTGGEPLIHDRIEDLLDRLADAGYQTTVETNGTIYRDAAIDLVSISPKLASSTPQPDNAPGTLGEWEQTHEERRIDMDALASLVEEYPFQLKFVVTAEDDIAEIQSLVSQMQTQSRASISGDEVLLMPEGATRERLAETRELTAELAMEHGYRYTPRLHVDLWNDAPGT